MSNLPALRHLHFRSISWATGPTDGNYAFPPMELESLVTSWSKKSAIENILLAIRARRLTWSFPRYPSSSDLSTMAYVRHLGNHLKCLELDFGEDLMPTLDLSANTSLGHLRVSDALRFNVIAARDQFDVAVCPTLEPLLSQVMTYARVDTLLLKVRTESRSIPALWNPLAQLFDLLDTPPFAAIRRVEFVVDGGSYCLEGSARLAKERFEPILRAAIPSRSDRQIVCNEGEDSYEIYC
ncbi:hypothetical protein FB451DRAFT_791496 [Mycena latifolia]|nr:hypothetical protein FB451DRAFT_791496 [Mycena latifolia]